MSKHNWNNNFLPTGDFHDNKRKGFPLWAAMMGIFLLLSFAKGNWLVFLFPAIWIGAVFFILSRGKKAAHTRNNPPPTQPMQRDYVPKAHKESKNSVEIPASYKRAAPRPTEAPAIFERRDLPGNGPKPAQDRHNHGGGANFDSYTGNYQTNTIQRCKCPKCGHGTDTSHRFCGRCDADLVRK